MNIINSKEKANTSKSWQAPGSTFYDKIKDSKSALHEAYLIVGDRAGEVSYSSSGCKYPHHAINRDGDLVLSIAGVKAAYSRAKQMGIFKGDVKKHLMRHYKELDIYKGSTMEADTKITENFNRIEEFLGIDESRYMIESTDNSSMEELESWIDNVAHNGFNESFMDEYAPTPVQELTPESLLTMMDQIAYDKSLGDWRLKSPEETIQRKLGNCHDQSLLELRCLRKHNYDAGQLFFIEVSDGEEVGGNTHTLTWYKDDHSKLWWMEHSWENYRGIHGPYNNINDLKDAVYKAWKNDNDINSRKFERIEFFDIPNYKVGMTLGEYVNSWVSDSPMDESIKVESTNIGTNIEKLWFITSDDGVDNACVQVKGYDKPMRGRSSMITLNPEESGEWFVLSKKHSDGDYGVPGGGWNKGEDPKDAAVRELKEEAQRKVRDVKRMGTLIEYHDTVKEWVKDHVNEKDWWYGYYSEIFVGIDNGISHAKIDERDKEEGYNWIGLSKAKEVLPKEYVKAIEDYISEQPVTESSETNEEWLPVYGVSTAASLGDLRNTGEKKTKDEMDSVGTRKLLSRISNGDHYNHILLSFNDDLTEMYSFNNHGIVRESIMDPTRWQSTESIYIAVMFFKKSDWIKMHDTCVDWVKNNRSETQYAYSDLIKLFFSKPVKHEKRFLCSSFAGYILSMSDRKMLNKDYQRMRPEDLTILPRSFYVMSVKDRDDFIARKSEFKSKVDKIYNEHIEEVEEYNNDLPKILLKDEMGKLSSFDKLIAWVFSKFAHAPDTVTESVYTEADEPPILDEEIPEDTEEKPEESKEETSEEPPSLEDDDIMNQPVEEEESNDEPPVLEDTPEEEPEEIPQKPVSMPKQTDAAEKDKNGVRRKKLYIAFIEWCKEYNNRNTFGSIFDKDIFHNVYPFVPDEMRYFYRLANPILCVLGGELTFFQVSELRKLNKDNKQMNKLLIFAATPNDLRIFNTDDNKVYLATEEGGNIKLGQVLGETFDTYIQGMIKKGDILNGPIESETQPTEE